MRQLLGGSISKDHTFMIFASLPQQRDVVFSTQHNQILSVAHPVFQIKTMATDFGFKTNYFLSTHRTPHPHWFIYRTASLMKHSKNLKACNFFFNLMYSFGVFWLVLDKCIRQSHSGFCLQTGMVTCILLPLAPLNNFSTSPLQGSDCLSTHHILRKSRILTPASSWNQT